jgi:hypothetical protein
MKISAIRINKSLSLFRPQYFPNDNTEKNLFSAEMAKFPDANYFPSHFVTRRVKMAALTLSKITSSLLVQHEGQKVNIGLNLKFEAKGQKVLGYTRKGDGGWEYSGRAIELIKEYRVSWWNVLGEPSVGN